MAQIDGGPSSRQSKRTSNAGATSATAVFANVGDYWTLAYSGAKFSLKDSKGLSYIQRLLRHPGEEFHALDLLSGAGPVVELADAEMTALTNEATVSVRGAGDAGEMLDAQAKREYKRRLLELSETLDDLRERGEHARAEAVESELDFLKREIARAIGLGGRDRRAGSAAERARLNVTRAIKGAVQKIAEHDAPLGDLLDRSLRTGSFCRYAADPRTPVSWQFSLGATTGPVAADLTAPFLLRRETNFLRALIDRTAFVGRETERGVLRGSLERVLAGEGRVVMIGGALGVGKSRIAGELCAEAAQRGFLTLVGACYDRDDSVPFSPFVEILEAAFAQAQSPETFRQALGNDAAEMARLMPQLHRMFPDIPPPMELSPEHSRRILFNAIAELLSRVAKGSPVLLLLEDLHWADEGTVSLLNHLARSIAKLPVIVVGTYRDNELDTAGPLAQILDELKRIHMLEHLSLRGLPESAVAAMIRALSGREPPQSIVTLFHTGTEGNPFFVEELYRHLVEHAKLFDSAGELRRDLKPEDIDVPQSLRLVIGRRLARLHGETRKVLGAAAVIGRSFTFELLEASTGADADSLLDRVEEAEKAGLISSTLDYPEARFQFSHELIRQSVLSELSAPRRQRLHLSVADAIERIHADTLDDQANDLAHHLWLAGHVADPDKTVRYLAMAARRALQQSAYDSAIRHFQNALERLSGLPHTQERAREELDLQIDFGVALLATKGWYVPEMGNAYGRALELCKGLGEDPRLFSVLSGLWSYHLVRGDHPKACSYIDEMLRLAESMHDDAMLVQAHWASGCSGFFTGKFASAHADLEQGIRHYNRGLHRTLAFRFGQDPAMSCYCFDAMTLWMLGYPDQAEQRAQASLALARELGYPFTLTWCLTMLAKYYSIRRDFSGSRAVIQEGLALTKEYGFAFFEESLIVYDVIGKAFQGNIDGLASLGGRAQGFAGAGYELAHTWARSVIAEVLVSLGQVDIAQVLLAEANELMERNQERYAESEIHRIRGELFRKQITATASTDREQGEAEAEKCFHTAIKIARERGAKMLELRAATSLASMLAASGKQAAARGALQPIHDWFTEGFDTPDLKAARSLLNDLEPNNASARDTLKRTPSVPR